MSTEAMTAYKQQASFFYNFERNKKILHLPRKSKGEPDCYAFLLRSEDGKVCFYEGVEAGNQEWSHLHKYDEKLNFIESSFLRKIDISACVELDLNSPFVDFWLGGAGEKVVKELRVHGLRQLQLPRCNKWR